MMTLDKDHQTHTTNKYGSSRTDILTTSFMNYLKYNFPFGDNWEHPITRKIWCNEEIKSALECIKIYSDNLIKSMHLVWLDKEAYYDYLQKRPIHYNVYVAKRHKELTRLVLVLLYYPQLRVEDIEL